LQARLQNIEKDYQLHRVCRLSVRSPSAWNISAPTGLIFMKFDVWVFFENLLWKFILHNIGEEKRYFTRRLMHFYHTSLSTS
jgi:hypothetical protein